jgi:hypothetical protein
LSFIICFSICFVWSYLGFMNLVFFSLDFKPSTLDLLEMKLCNFFFIKLSLYYDLGSGFNKLDKVDFGCFFIHFSNWFFFSISSFNIRLIRNWIHNFFISFLWDYSNLITRVGPSWPCLFLGPFLIEYIFKQAL